MRFVQFADIHLDSNLGGALDLPPEKKEALRDDIRTALARACALAREIKADLVLVPGDLFDYETARGRDGRVPDRYLRRDRPGKGLHRPGQSRQPPPRQPLSLAEGGEGRAEGGTFREKGFPKQRELKDVYKPWSGESYALDMLLESGGRRLSVERDFPRERFVVRDALTNRDISAEFETDLAAHIDRLGANRSEDDLPEAILRVKAALGAYLADLKSLREVERGLAGLERDIAGKRGAVEEELDAVLSILSDAGIAPRDSLEEALRAFEEGEKHYRRFVEIKDSLLPTATIPRCSKTRKSLRRESEKISRFASRAAGSFPGWGSRFPSSSTPP